MLRRDQTASIKLSTQGTQEETSLALNTKYKEEDPYKENQLHRMFPKLFHLCISALINRIDKRARSVGRMSIAKDQSNRSYAENSENKPKFIPPLPTYESGKIERIKLDEAKNESVKLDTAKQSKSSKKRLKDPDASFRSYHDECITGRFIL
jgi:hypothetical protein